MPKKLEVPKNVFLRGNTYCFRKMVDGERKTVSLGTSDLRTAIDMAKEYERQVALEGLGIKAERHYTFDQAWDEYLTSASGKKARSLEQENCHWPKFSRFCEARGIRTIDGVRPVDVLAWQTSLRPGRAPVTVNNYVHGYVGTIWSHLHRLELVEHNPFLKVRRMKQPEVQTKSLPWDKILVLLDGAKELGQDIHLFFILGALGGLRKGEILRARWEHVDWDNGSLFVDGEKSRSSKGDIPLHSDLRVALEPYRQDAGYMVKPEADSKSQYRWGPGWQWEQVVVAADMEEVTPHWLRHSVAQRLFNLGRPIQEVSAFLRHKNLSATMRYAKVKNVVVQIEGSLR